jgi:hypothetical protein
MTKEECLEFLELPRNANNATVESRLKEKYTFFKMLHANAPNQIIRNLQEKNLNKLEEIKDFFSFNDTPDKNKQPGVNYNHSNNENNNEKINSKKDTVLAWLVLHTEDKKTKSFPLFDGINAIGRQSHEKYPSIVLADDSYVSRTHCFITVLKSDFHITASLADDGKLNNGKPSRNGTYINGKENRIATKIINENDTLQIGMTKLMFKWNSNSIKEIEEIVDNSNFVGTVVINI